MLETREIDSVVVVGKKCVGSSMARTRSQIPPHVASLLFKCNQILGVRDHRVTCSAQIPVRQIAARF
jgi:hypothetical protein